MYWEEYDASVEAEDDDVRGEEKPEMFTVIIPREKLAIISIVREEITLHWPIKSTKEQAKVLTANEEDRVNLTESGTIEELINLIIKPIGSPSTVELNS